jgi:AraC-like DNA-binding protein
MGSIRAMESTVSAVAFTRVVTEASRELGIDVTALLGAQRSTDRSLAQRITLGRFEDLLTQIMRDEREARFPIAVARATRVEDLEQLGFALTTASDGRAWFDTLVRFHPLWASCVRITTAETPATVTLRFEPSSFGHLGARVGIELLVATVWSLLQAALGTSERPIGVYFRHNAPRVTTMHTSHFGTRVHWGAGFDGLRFTPDSLRYAVRSADPALHAFFVRDLERLLGDRGPGSAIERVRTLVRRQLRTAASTSRSVAREIGMSERALRRALAAAGTSYREILRDARLEVADGMLRDPRWSVRDVASATGFADPSAFGRFYRHHRGHAPGRARSTVPPAMGDGPTQAVGNDG